MNLKNLSEEEFQNILDQMSDELSSIGLECHPFKIEWYNKMVSPKFKLNFDDNCIAFLIISTPDMFEKAFIPYLQNNWSDKEVTTDPIDECMKYHLNRLKSKLCDQSIEVIHDFEILPNKMPKVLVQTAAHVSGAAFYYKSNLNHSTQNSKERLIGVCIHPLFGGWFALRAVLVFNKMTTNSLKQKQPIDVIPINQQKDLLIQFNYHWKDWKYRDIIPVIKKYSDLQIKYFSLKPSERKAFIKHLLQSIN